MTLNGVFLPFGGYFNRGTLLGYGGQSTPLSRVQAAAPDFVAWWTSADPTSMLLASDGVGGFVSASGQTVGGWLNVKDCGSKTFAEYLAAQPELVTNGGFDTDVSGWSQGQGTPTITWVDGTIEVFSAGTGNLSAVQPISMEVGKQYLVSVDHIDNGSGGWVIMSSAEGSWSTGRVDMTNGATSFGTNTRLFTATQTTHYLHLMKLIPAADVAKFDNISIKELPTLPLLQASGASEPQYLLSGGIGSLNADGSDDHLSTGTLASALPSDCAVYARVKTTDNRGYIFSGAATDSNEYFFCFQDGLTSPVYGNVGSPTLYVDGVEFTGHRGDYYDAISDGVQHSLVARSIDLSGLAALTLATYLPSPSVNYVAAAFGDILIVPEALLTAQPTIHADIMAMMAARYPS